MTPDQQAELRERRRHRLPHSYPRGWSLTRELAEVTGPLAARAADLGIGPRGRVAWSIDRVADAAHGVVSEVAALLTRADAERRCRHLSTETRGRATNTLVDLKPRPKRPDLTDAEITRGRWSGILVALAEPYSDDLADLLGRVRPDAETRTGRGANYQLTAALRELDAAADDLRRAIDRAELAAAQQRRAQEQATEQPDPRAEELRRLGIELPA